MRIAVERATLVQEHRLVEDGHVAPAPSPPDAGRGASKDRMRVRHLHGGAFPTDARGAEQEGFDALGVSDHFAPWFAEARGHRLFVSLGL